MPSSQFLLQLTRLFACLIALITNYGCATAPLASTAADVDAKQFTAKADLARLYIVRDQSFGGAIQMHVTVDGIPIGHTAAQTYFALDLSPGKHLVGSRAENMSELTVNLESDVVYFLRQEVQLGMLMARNELRPITPDIGRALVAQCRLIALPKTVAERLEIQRPKTRSGMSMDDLKDLL